MLVPLPLKCCVRHAVVSDCRKFNKYGPSWSLMNLIQNSFKIVQLTQKLRKGAQT